MHVKAHVICRVRKQTEMERRKSVVRIFINMFAGSIKRYQIWNVVPWDPGAWSGPRIELPSVLLASHTCNAMSLLYSQPRVPDLHAILVLV